MMRLLNNRTWTDAKKDTFENVSIGVSLEVWDRVEYKIYYAVWDRVWDEFEEHVWDEMDGPT